MLHIGQAPALRYPRHSLVRNAVSGEVITKLPTEVVLVVEDSPTVVDAATNRVQGRPDSEFVEFHAGAKPAWHTACHSSWLERSTEHQRLVFEAWCGQ